MESYIEEKYVDILKQLELYNPINKKIRLGNVEDGGYIIIDSYKYDCFLSAGIAKDISFDVDFINKHPDVQSYAIDGTVERPDNLPDKTTFIKNNINAKNDKNNSAPYSNSGMHTYTGETTNLKEYVENYNDVFIKMDIEGEEWSWMLSFNDYFSKVKQFVFEAHAMFPHEIDGYLRTSHCYLPSDEWADNVLNALKTINKTHYVVHMRQNLAAPFIHIGNNDYPSFCELTFIRKSDSLISGYNKNDLPIDIDFENESLNNIIKKINFWPFKI